MPQTIEKSTVKSLTWVVGFMILLSVALIIVAEKLLANYHVFKLVFEHIAAILFAVCTFHLIDHWILNRYFMTTLRKHLSEAVDEAMPDPFAELKMLGW